MQRFARMISWEAGRILAFTLVLALASPVRAAGGLEIAVIEGRDARHQIGSFESSPTAVQIKMEGKPVRGARVRFQLPEFGPGGKFADGMRDNTAFTNEQGVAYMAGFRPNGIEGRFTLLVDANYAGVASAAGLSQSNVSSVSRPVERAAGSSLTAGKSRASSKLLLVLGIGAAAAIGGAFALRSGSPKGVPTTVSVGGIGVGGGN